MPVFSFGTSTAEHSEHASTQSAFGGASSGTSGMFSSKTTTASSPATPPTDRKCPQNFPKGSLPSVPDAKAQMTFEQESAVLRQKDFSGKKTRQKDPAKRPVQKDRSSPAKRPSGNSRLLLFLLTLPVVMPAHDYYKCHSTKLPRCPKSCAA